MLRLESERIKQELHKQKQELDRRKNEMLRKAREQADEIYRSSRRESEAILKSLPDWSYVRKKYSGSAQCYAHHQYRHK